MHVNLGKVFGVISGMVHVVDTIATSGPNKKAAILDAIPESVALAELGVGHDLVNDAEIGPLVSALIDAEAAVLKVRAQIRAVLVKRQASA